MVFSGVWALDTDARHPTKPSQRAKETQNGLFLRTIVPFPLMDKNLFWGKLNLSKRDFCVKAIMARRMSAFLF